MNADDQMTNAEAMEAVVERQFRSLGWTRDASADWETFLADFLPGARCIRRRGR